MKKTIGILIAVFTAVLMSVTVFTAFAADAPVAVSSTAFETHQGESFTTTVFIPDNANIVDFDITLNYDTDLLTLVSAEEHEDLRGDISFNTIEPGTIHLNYTRTSQNITHYLPLINLTFAVDENIGVGVYDCLAVDRSKTYVAHRLNASNTLEMVDFSCDFAQLIIYEMGDVDLSCGVDIGDATYIRRHLAQLEGSILTPFKLTLADTYTDGSVDIRDAACLQRHLAQLDVLYGNRVHLEFFLPDGTKYTAKSVFYEGTLNKIPPIPAEYEGYSWSLSPTELIPPQYSNLTEDMKIYLFYDGVIESEAMQYYKGLLTDMYYSGDLPSNISSSLNLKESLYYQNGYHAMLTWSSSSNYVLNSTTGVFTKPTYPQDLGLSISITSYDANDTIEGKGSITFDYLVPGIYITPKKSEVEDFLKFYFTDSADGKYRINYDAKLLAKVNNTVLPAEGSMYDNFEIRLNWFKNVDGELQPVSQVKRTAATQINDYVAVATFNGKPLEDDGKIYLDDVEVTAIDQMEIKNYIIQQIAAYQGTLATDGTTLWNNDTRYDTSVTWETGNAKIGYVSQEGVTVDNKKINKVHLTDDAVSGSTLPLNAKVSYAVDNGETEEFVLSYNLTVSCNNTIIKAPENMDLGLYKAIKIELEDTLGYRGDLTSAALANVKFVNLDLSKYQKLAKEYEILRAEHPEQYPDDVYPEITSFRGLSYCTNLRTLNISGIQVTDGSMNQIATLSYLEAFIARGCNLDNLADGGTPTLRNAVRLKMLDLTDNNFTSLNSVFAEGVRYGSLREVYLSKNKLTNINALSRAPMMTYLSLSENGLTTAGTTAIANYPYLVYLSLAHNKIDSVEHLKNLKNLKELRLQDNNLSNINDLRRLVNLQVLYLGHNQIQDIGFLNSLTELEILYANDNRIFDISALTNLTKLEAINVSNNKITSLSVLLNYRSTLTEVYAENNKATDFSFINGATGLRFLMLAGNATEMVQDNMTSWLSGLTNLEVLTLSEIRLSDLSFLASMDKLVRLDVENCGLTAFSNDASNIMAIADRYMTLKVLNISNNNLGDPTNEILKLRNLSLLTLFFADNICTDLDINTITYAMPELKFISLENCGVNSMGWLTKYAGLVYVDLAGNNIADFDLDNYISNASIKTIKELYLDTNAENTFANAYRVTDFNVEKLSLEGIQIGEMTKMPYLDNINYLNISNTGLTNLTGDDPEVADLYTVERYETLQTIDVSGLETDITPLENMDTLETVYAVGTAENEIFHEGNLHALQRLYNKGVTCYLYDKQTEYVPVATVEGTEILALLKDDISCEVTVAADNQFSDTNPFLQDEINDFDIAWTVSNNTNYEIKNNHLSVKDYTYIDDETLTITAAITVYPDQAPVTREFTVHTHILRASPEYYELTASNYSSQLTRDARFDVVVKIKASETEHFENPVKPVVDSIDFSHEVGGTVPYPNIVTESGISFTMEYNPMYGLKNGRSFTINSSAPLGESFTIKVDICHLKSANEKVSDIEQILFPVTVVSRTFTATFVMNGGTITDSNGVSFDTREYAEDSMIFDGLVYDRLGYNFEGWYLDAGFTQLFSKDGVNAIMPSHDVTLYAKWEANSFKLHFNANADNASVDMTEKLIICDTAFGDLATATRQYYIFDGWFTEAEGGEQVTATSIMTRSDDLTVYAHWTPDTYVLTFNPNGGTVSEGNRTVFCGQQLGTLPSPKRDYYTFKSWNTKSDGTGTTVTVQSSFNQATTIYAQWEQNPILGWVLSSNAPAGAQIVETKYSFTHRYYKESGNSSESGWTKYNTKRTSWGATQGPVYSDPSNGSRNVWSESYVSGYGTKHTYHFYKYGYSELDYSYRGAGGGRTKYDVYLNYMPSSSGQRPVDKDGSTYRWFAGGGTSWAAVYYENEYDETNYNDPKYGTRWYYQEPVYTYYYYKDVSEESTTRPSGDEYSNIQTWVKYRAK